LFYLPAFLVLPLSLLRRALFPFLSPFSALFSRCGAVTIYLGRWFPRELAILFVIPSEDCLLGTKRSDPSPPFFSLFLQHNDVRLMRLAGAIVSAEIIGRRPLCRLPRRVLLGLFGVVGCWCFLCDVCTPDVPAHDRHLAVLSLCFPDFLFCLVIEATPSFSLPWLSSFPFPSLPLFSHVCVLVTRNPVRFCFFFPRYRAFGFPKLQSFSSCGFLRSLRPSNWLPAAFSD